ncbi:hypothetical protein N8387_00630 [Polaribacter sp.]|nr:hypothetical protein [Polaribacter sp.]MDC1464169.1 hypothetical protein [Polaribacter sp.]
MKNILLILTLSITSLASCQVTSNIISETEFNNIKINNITLSDIKATEGNQTELRNLIPAIISESNVDPDGEFSHYSYDGFEIGFSGNLGTIEHPILGAFTITNGNWNITIQGASVTIGDSISALGSPVINNDTDGGKSIVYQYCDGCNNFIYIEFDQFTNKITEIGFIEQT